MLNFSLNLAFVKKKVDNKMYVQKDLLFLGKVIAFVILDFFLNIKQI